MVYGKVPCPFPFLYTYYKECSASHPRLSIASSALTLKGGDHVQEEFSYSPDMQSPFSFQRTWFH